MKLPLLVTAISVGLLGVYITAPPAAAVLTDCAGPGTDYTISSQSDLRVLATDARCRASDLTFTLAGSIILDSPWTPIGTLASPFRGTFDGNGKTISGLSIPEANNDSGLFGYTDGATIQGVNLTSVDVDGGTEAEHLGALIGLARDTEIRNISASGSVDCDTPGTVAGGIVGWARSSGLEDVSSSVDIRLSSSSGSYVGGVAGRLSNSSLVGSESDGDVRGFQFIGGLVGFFDVDGLGVSTDTFRIENVTSRGHVTGNSSDANSLNVGGLVGQVRAYADGESFDVEVDDATALGDVTANLSVGGLIGSLILEIDRYSPGSNISLTVTDSVAEGDVHGSSAVGGFVGGANSGSGLKPAMTIDRNSSTGSVTGNDTVGGFAGSVASLDVSHSHAAGDVTSTGSSVGGWAGLVDSSSILNGVYSTGNVQGITDVGGLVGIARRNTSISRSWSTGDVRGNDTVGGLIGVLQDEATVVESYARGSVAGAATGSRGGWVSGGLIGSMFDHVSVSRSFSSGDVSGLYRVGGLVGQVDGATTEPALRITNSYSTGSASASGLESGSQIDSAIGALIGLNRDLVSATNTYATGLVSSPPGSFYVGGITGHEFTPLTASGLYWDSQSTGKSNATVTSDNSPASIAGAAPLTSAQMRSASNFSGWDFTSVWGYDCSNSTRPLLRWAYPSATATSCPAAAPDTGGGGGTPAPSPVGTTATPGEATRPLSDGVSAQAPGSSGMRVNGREVPVTTDRGGRGNGLKLQAGPVEFTLRSQTANGQRVPLAPDGSLILPRTGEVPISGDGLEPNSTVVVTLFSDPVSLGSTSVGADGKFRVSPVIPLTVPLGAHTLELSGRTKTGDPFVLSVGVLVETPAAALGADPVLNVRPSVLAPGASLAVTARGVQAGCRVTFAVAGERALARASTKGVAQSRITLPQRLPKTVVLRATVSGPRCSAVSVSKDISSRPSKKRKAASH